MVTGDRLLQKGNQNSALVATDSLCILNSKHSQKALHELMYDAKGGKRYAVDTIPLCIYNPSCFRQL